MHSGALFIYTIMFGDWIICIAGWVPCP